MRRDELLHVARAACRVAGVRRVLIAGSQAILGAYDETQLPPEAIMSVEADVVVADLCAGKLGAGRPQDRRFVQALARRGDLVDLELVRRLIMTMDDGIGARTRASRLVDVLLDNGSIDHPSPPS